MILIGPSSLQKFIKILYIFLGKCMFLSGLLPRPMTAEDDRKLLEHGIGFTNIVERTTKGTANLTRREIEEGI